MKRWQTVALFSLLPACLLLSLSAASKANRQPPLVFNPEPTAIYQQAETDITYAHIAGNRQYSPAPTETPEPPYSDSDIEMLAKTVYGEAGICAEDEQRLVIWTVLQRVDAGGYGDSISDVITAKHQFVGYSPDNPIEPDIYELCANELAAWHNGADIDVIFAIGRAFGIEQKHVGKIMAYLDTLPRGAVVATADIVRCDAMWDGSTAGIPGAVCIDRVNKYWSPNWITITNEYLFGDWRPGRYAYEFSGVQPLAAPIPAKGSQGFWNWRERP